MFSIREVSLLAYSGGTAQAYPVSRLLPASSNTAEPCAKVYQESGALYQQAIGQNEESGTVPASKS